MDILKPDLMWIEGRCYRINLTDPSFNKLENEAEEWANEDGYRDNDGECPLDESCDESELEITENGRYRTSFHVARSYFARIIGFKGATLKRLEGETKTQIRVPRQRQDGNIIITGSDKRGVSAARRRINLIVMSARLKQPFTHFLSIPFIDSSIKANFCNFKKEVLEECTDRGIDASIFQMPDKLHLTIGTLVLADSEERKKATEVMEQCKELIIDPLLEKKPLRLKMVGLEYMNDDPAEVDVLYGKVELVGDTNVLQDLANSIVEFFSLNDLMEKQYDQVKLHVTLMNTLFREDKGGVSDLEITKKKQRPRESFDARTILKIYDKYNFGEQVIDAIHLSQRYTTANNGYYQASSTISLT